MTLTVPQGAGPHLFNWHVMSQVLQGPDGLGQRAALPLHVALQAAPREALEAGKQGSGCPAQVSAQRVGDSPATEGEFYSARLPACAEQAPCWIKAPQMRCGLWEPILGPCHICRALFWPEGSQHMGKVGWSEQRPSPFMTAPPGPGTPPPYPVFSAMGTAALSQLPLSVSQEAPEDTWLVGDRMKGDISTVRTD